MTTSGEMIRDARTRAGLTQAQLARLASTSQPTVAAYESGAKIPTADTFARLLRAAGLTLTTVPLEKDDRSSRLRQLLKKRRDDILELAARHGAENVRVFGSIARGQERQGSDIDLLVDMEAGRSLLDQVRLRRSLIQLLGVEVDVVTARGLRDSDSRMVSEATPL